MLRGSSFWTPQEAVGHVDLRDSWFPSKIARFSFRFLKQPKKTEEKVPCGPCACMRCCPKKRFHLCFALTIKVTCLLNSGTVIALSSVKATGVRFFRCKTNVIARTIDYRTCSSLWSVSFSLPANLRNLLPRLPAEIFTQWIEEPCLRSCHGSGAQFEPA